MSFLQGTQWLVPGPFQGYPNTRWGVPGPFQGVLQYQVRGYLSPRWGYPMMGYSPGQVRMGYLPGQVRMGYPHPLGHGRMRYPLPRTGWGTPGQVRMGSPPPDRLCPLRFPAGGLSCVEIPFLHLPRSENALCLVFIGLLINLEPLLVFGVNSFIWYLPTDFQWVQLSSNNFRCEHTSTFLKQHPKLGFYSCIQCPPVHFDAFFFSKKF